MTNKLFSELGLSPEILKAVDKMGFEQASPIQAETIPILMQGLDVVGQSQTGSGKTAAFGIPAIEKVDVTKKVVQVIILCPTRELAMQVCEEVYKLAAFKRGIHAVPIYGGQSYDRQYQGLRQGAQIVIGTPGRVMDHMRRGTLRLEHVKIAILDEADVMLDMGFREDIEFILQAVPATRQTVFFSATMPRPIQDLIQRFSHDAKNLRIEQKTMTVATTEQVYYEVDRRFKVELLTRLIDFHDLKLGIIFCNTKRMVDDLVDHLNAQGYSADRLHGDMTQNMRDRVMNKFRKSELEFLVATDVAARGIDVDDVQVVFNYDLPYDAEDYVHRIGRTGRAGKSGLAVSFVDGREMFQIRHIERFANIRIIRARVPTLDEVEEARNSSFLDKVRVILESGEFKKQDRLVEQLTEKFSSADVCSALIHLLQQGEGAPDRSSESYDRPERGDDRRGGSRDRIPDRRDRYDAPPAAQPARTAARPALTPRPASPAAAPAPVVKRIAKPAAAPAPALVPAPAPVATAVTPEAAKPAPAPVPGPAAPAIVPKPAKPAPIAEATAPTPAPVAAPVVVPKTPTPPAIVAAPALAAPQPPVETPAPTPAVREPKAPSRVKPSKPAAEAGPVIATATPLSLLDTKPKASRRTPEDQTRLYMNIGSEMGVLPQDIVALVMGETGLPAKVVGTVDIRERHLFVDVAAEHTNAIVARLNRARLKEKKIKVKVA